MTDAWFAGADPGDPEPGTARVRTGNASIPIDWPVEAVDAGFAAGESDYYAKLHLATFAAVNEAVAERERADDVQLAHAVRAMDDAERTANEFVERVVEWAGTLYEEVSHGLNSVRDIAVCEPKTAAEERVVSYATHVVDLLDERDDLRVFIGERAPTTTSNLAEMTRPVLVARLITLAGGLEPPAKKPSRTVQVLGTEDALFAHLKGRATSPEHSVIFTHEYVHGMRPEDHGSAARTLVGKLAIAARVDYYLGDYRPDLHAELADQMETICAHADERDDE